MLDAMPAFQLNLECTNQIRTPRLYHFNRSTKTQIIEDLSGTMSLTEALTSNTPFTGDPNALGKALGKWLRNFHSWTADGAQAHLRRSVYENSAMRRIRYDISYGAFVDVLKNFPNIWEAKGQILEKVKSMATEEYARTPHDELNTSWGVVHGDFWTGKYVYGGLQKCLR